MRRPQTRAADQALYREATALVRRQFRWPELTLEFVARELAVSARQVQRVFRSEGDTTFRAYLLRVRMEHARRLRERGYASNRTIAPQVGYSHWGNGFAKAYRRYWDTAP
jgi:AraC family transcriptional regulator, carnitine catabolism transcriptional activator